MADATRVLFVSGEVAPFAKVTDTAKLVRTLPEKLVERGDYETRIMMPRYGTISERRNRLHEVIRLSGTEIPMGDDVENLKVKVASIPGIRLQVYFMDNTTYFKRKGVYAMKKSGKRFDDNAARALFFARSVLETTRNLGWQPDVIHAHCWMSGFLPLLLKTEYADAPLFQNAKVVFTPADGLDDIPEASADLLAMINLGNREALPMSLNELGMAHADAVILAPTEEAMDAEQPRLSGDDNAMATQAHTLYTEVLEADGALA